MRIFSVLVKPLVLSKARKITNHCRKFVSGKVLDVGAGRCYIAKHIQERCNVNVTCIDIDNLNETDLKLIVYDGKKIPFASGTFNTVLIVYVLHHCKNPIDVLKECRRVCKKGGKIIIFEDIGYKFPTYVFDLLGNKLHNVEAPLNFKKHDEWLRIFKDLNLKLVYLEKGVEKQVFYPCVGHTMFVLEVKN